MCPCGRKDSSHMQMDGKELGRTDYFVTQFLRRHGCFKGKLEGEGYPYYGERNISVRYLRVYKMDGLETKVVSVISSN